MTFATSASGNFGNFGNFGNLVILVTLATLALVATVAIVATVATVATLATPDYSAKYFLEQLRIPPYYLVWYIEPLKSRCSTWHRTPSYGPGTVSYLALYYDSFIKPCHCNTLCRIPSYLVWNSLAIVPITL